MFEQPEPKPKSKIPLIAGVAALSTVLAGGAFFAGMNSSGNMNSNTNPPTNQTITNQEHEPEIVDLKIKGNKNSRIYHLKNCPNYNDIADRNIEWFATEADAGKAKYRKAKNCR